MYARVVKPILVRLPGLDLASSDALSLHVDDSALDKHVLALALRCDSSSSRNLCSWRISSRLKGEHAQETHVVSVLREEGAKHGRLSRSFGLGVVDGINKSRETEDVGKKNELLPDVAANLSRRGEEVDCLPARGVSNTSLDMWQTLLKAETYIHSCRSKNQVSSLLLTGDQASTNLRGEPDLASKVVDMLDELLKDKLLTGEATRSASRALL